jgi:hypothetical protein
MRTLITTIAAGLALVAAVPATTSARSARPTKAQATQVTQRLAADAAEGVRSFGIFEIERVSVSCGAPFGSGSHSVTCAYALFVRNTQDGTRHLCVNSVHVLNMSRAGRLYGSQTCF